MKVEHLVADSGAFIRNAALQDLGSVVYTCKSVVDEIKDKATKKRLAVLPYELKFSSPSSDAIQKVTEVSKLSGDYPSLSITDIQVLALTYDLSLRYDTVSPVNETNVNDAIKKDVIQYGGTMKQDANIPGFYIPDETPDDELETNTADDEMENQPEDKSDEEVDEVTDEMRKVQIDENYVSLVDESEECDTVLEDVTNACDDTDDADTWITPAKLQAIKSSINDENEGRNVACLTTDFAMQNVLLKMKLGVLSVDGLLIKSTRNYVLRCHACFAICKIMTKVFCPKCGNKTLKRVPVEIQADGTMKMFFSRNPKVLSRRGLVHSLPTPKGGKHACNPILCEDQNVPHNRVSKKALARTDVWGDDYDTMTSPFSKNEINSRAFKVGYKGARKSRGTNPNAVGKKFVKRRK